MKTFKLLLSLCAVLLTGAVSWGQTVSGAITNGVNTTGGVTQICDDNNNVRQIELVVAASGYNTGVGVALPTVKIYINSTVYLNGTAANTSATGITGLFSINGTGNGSNIINIGATGSGTLGSMAAATTYQITVEISGGFLPNGDPAGTRFSYHNVFANRLPHTASGTAINVTASPSAICGGQSALVRINNPLAGITYNWNSTIASNGAGVPTIPALETQANTMAGVTGNQRTITPTNVGVNGILLRATSFYAAERNTIAAGNSCSSLYTPVTTVTVEGPAAPAAMADVRGCVGTIPVTTLNTLGAASVAGCGGAPAGANWYLGGTLVSGTAPITSIAAGTTTYTLRCRSSAGCLSAGTDMKIVGVAKPSIPSVTTAPTSLCRTSSGSIVVTPACPAGSVAQRYFGAAVQATLSPLSYSTGASTASSPITTGNAHTYPNGAGETPTTYTCVTAYPFTDPATGVVTPANTIGAPQCESDAHVLTVVVANGPAIATVVGSTSTPTICLGSSAKLSVANNACAVGETIAWYKSPYAAADIVATATSTGALTGTNDVVVTPGAAGTVDYKVRCERGSCYSEALPIAGGAIVTVTVNSTGTAIASPTAPLALTATSVCLSTVAGVLTPSVSSITVTPGTCSTAGSAFVIYKSDLTTSVAAGITVNSTSGATIPLVPGAYNFYAACQLGGCNSAFQVLTVTVSNQTTGIPPTVTVPNTVVCDNHTAAAPATINVPLTTVLATSSCGTGTSWQLENAATGAAIGAVVLTAGSSFTYGDIAGGYTVNTVYRLKASCQMSACASASSTTTSSTFIFTETKAPLINVKGVAAPGVDGGMATKACKDGVITLLETSGTCAGITTWERADNSSTTYSTIGTGSVLIDIPSGNVTTAVYRAWCDGITCDSKPSLTVTVTINDNPVAPTITATATPAGCQPIATNVSVGLSATCGAGETVSYERTGDATFLTATLPTAAPAFTATTPDAQVVQGTAFTVYYRAKCTNATTMCSTASVATSVTFTTQVAAPSVAVSTTNICEGSAVTLTATGCTGSVSWFNASGTLVATGSSAQATPAAGTNSYRATCTVGTCTSLMSGSTATVTITAGVPAGSFAINAASDATLTSATVCAAGSTSGATANLQTVGCTGAIDWYNGAVTLANRVATGTNTYSAGAGTYTATCQQGNCTINSATFVVSALAAVTPTITPSIAIPSTGLCLNSPLTLTAMPTGASAYIWSGTGLDLVTGANLNNPTISTAQVTSVMAGDYTVSILVGTCTYTSAPLTLTTTSASLIDLNIINVGSITGTRTPGLSIVEWPSAAKTSGSPTLANSSAGSPTLYSTTAPVDGGGNPVNGGSRHWTAEAKFCSAIAPASVKFTVATITGGAVAGVKIENAAPWFLFGNTAYAQLWSVADPIKGFGIATGWPVGEYTIKIDAYNALDGTGTLLGTKTFQFEVTNSAVIRQGVIDSKINLVNDMPLAVVMPNPVNNTLNVQINGAKGQNVDLNFTDLQGRSIIRKGIKPATDNHTESFDVSRQASGMYMLNVVSETKKAALKVIKAGN